MTNQMNDIVVLTDKVAGQSDRWLFVFLLLTGLAAVYIFFRWLTKDRATVANRLTEVTDRHIVMQQVEKKL